MLAIGSFILLATNINQYNDATLSNWIIRPKYPFGFIKFASKFATFTYENLDRFYAHNTIVMRLILLLEIYFRWE